MKELTADKAVKPGEEPIDPSDPFGGQLKYEDSDSASSSGDDSDGALDGDLNDVRDANDTGVRKAQTLLRRETVFAKDAGSTSKTKKDLKRAQLFQIMEYKTVGKSRPYELAGETNQNLLVRFLIHFLFVEHDHKNIDLFDAEDAIF
jgi:hypothetical protein